MIVALVGYARVGKDTVAGLICEHNEIKRVAFADELKRDICNLLGITMAELNENKEMIRPLLVEYGRMRRIKNPNYWIDRLIMHLDDRHGEGWAKQNWIITDCRYPNEVAWVLDMGGQVLRIVRDGYGSANDEEGRSITEILNGRPEIPTVTNHEGRPGQCADEVWKLITK